jgi:hypothetical protein
MISSIEAQKIPTGRAQVNAEKLARSRGSRGVQLDTVLAE